MIQKKVIQLMHLMVFLFFYIDPTFFKSRQANVFLKGKKIGIIGILHPKVLENYKINFPVAVVELYIESLLNE
jgi:phenylalanyl-tRNA synthetase beta chain